MGLSTFFLITLLFCSAFAHVCMLSPPQRGTMNDLNTIATADCFLTTGPCGGRPAQVPNVMLIGGTNFTVSWQKNENHWTQSQPGTFNVSWADESVPDKFYELESFTDTNTPALTLYEYQLDVSQITSPKVILQVAYVAPSLPATFYQCADVVIMS
eukprot:Phypoly_transcript_23312.p1 GENE.Phypoly_transcript_23312~~Phypoly_transcript_23312.p1  ORF type:complete len:164 (-),score=24.44 Phypoly_transcript_23312:92-559(-)